MARLVPIRNRASKPRRYPCGDGSIISHPRGSEDTGQTWPGLLHAGDGARSAGKRRRNCRIVHSAHCGHEYFAATIPTDQIQTMDAQCPRALVARAAVGIGNLRPMVHPGLVLEMSSWRSKETTAVEVRAPRSQFQGTTVRRGNYQETVLSGKIFCGIGEYRSTSRVSHNAGTKS